jgi:YD repeat-containing protein
MRSISYSLLIFIFLITCCINNNARGQNSATQFCLSNPIPAPPGSASLANYSTMPVNLYAGKPVIDIPLWELKSRSLSIPIKLSYNSSGIKVQEPSDWVGMGWTLMAGGAITRTVRGLPDDQAGNGFLDVGSELPTDLSQLYYIGNFSYYQCQSVADGLRDYEPDIFTFTFPGHSGDIIFWFDSLKAIHYNINPYQDLKVTYNNLGTIGPGIHSWTIVDESGTTYIFGSDLQDTVAVEKSSFDQGSCGDMGSPNYTSSWALKKIISPTKGDTIDFYYKKVVEHFDFIGASEYENIRLDNLAHCSGLTDWTSIFPSIEYKACPNSSDIVKAKLKGIRTASTLVNFFSDTSITNTSGGVKLDSIVINDRNKNSTIRSFLFHYSYTWASSVSTPWINGGSELSYRLWMDSINEKNSGISKTYKMFYYHHNELPARSSWCLDHWGYFNSNPNHTLIPSTNISGTYYGGADRTCDTSKVKFGMIDSIVYPTGGNSKFYYEANDFFHTQSGPVITINYKDLNTDVFRQCGAPIDDTIFKGFYVDHDQYVAFDINTGKCGNPQDGLQAYVGVLKDSQVIHSWSNLSNTTKNLFLSAGNYRLFASAEVSNNFATIEALWQNCDTTVYQDTVYYQFGGGVRIKRIVDFDGKQSSVRHFIYRLTSNPFESSGNLMGTLPSYTFPSIRNYGYAPTNDPLDLTVCSYSYLTITANTTRQQQMTQGNYVGYSSVTELLGENGENGKIVHNYYVPRDIGGDYFPYPPKTSNEWKRGMEEQTKTYDLHGHLRKDELNLYQATDKSSQYNFHSIGAVKIGWRSKWVNMGVQPLDWQSEFSFAPYEIYCGWEYNYKKISISYDEFGQNPVYDSTNFIYEHPDHNLQVTKTSHFNSDGIEKIKRYRYPQDYTGTGYDTYGFALAMMRDSLHMVNSIVEYLESERKTSDTTELITGGNIDLFTHNCFSYISFMGIYPYKCVGLETTTPFALSSFNRSYINNSGTFVYDNHFITDKVTYDVCDRYGNLLHYHLTDNIPISLNWGFNNTVLITKAVNSSYDPTNSYSGSNIQVTRFLYNQPLIGVSGIIDPTGITTHYEYDPLGRLKVIRNDDNNILQKIDYHYKTN